MRMSAILVAIAAGAGLGAAAGCTTSTYGGGGGGGGGHSTTITVSNNKFQPSPDTVAAGQVTFTWATPSNGHTVTWDSGPGTLPTSTGTLTTGSVIVTLQAGTYQYHCAIHGGVGTGMHGTLVVQ